jgi:hypothetical protein
LRMEVAKTTSDFFALPPSRTYLAFLNATFVYRFLCRNFWVEYSRR